MRTLLYLKQLDLAAQLVALTLPVALGAATGNSIYLMFCYLAVGGVQVISCILNRGFLDQMFKNKGRFVYQYILVGMGLIIFFSFLFKSGWLMCTFIPSPVLAIWYMWMSYREASFIRRLVNRKQYV